MNWINYDQESINPPIDFQLENHNYNKTNNNKHQSNNKQQSISHFDKQSEQPQVYCYNIPETYKEKSIIVENDYFDSEFGSEENQIKEYLERKTEKRQISVMEDQSQYGGNDYDNDLIQPIPIALNLSLVQKSSLTKKIQQLALKRKNDNQSDAISVSTNDQNMNNEQQNGELQILRRKRKVITSQILQQLKILFKDYNKNVANQRGKLSFRIISQKVDISIAQVKCLYEQYVQDPQFKYRLNKINEKINNQLIYKSPIGNISSITNKRIKFIQALIRERGSLTTHQIVDEMSHVQALHNIDKNGQKIQITRRLVQNILNIANIKPKKVPFAARNINTYDCIHNRFRYAAKYLDLTADKASDICFVGQFSFVNNLSLSSCPIMKRDSFVDIRYIRGEPKPKNDSKLKSDLKAQTGTGNPDDRYGRNLQYLIVLSLHGVIYYELYYDIFNEMKFYKTLENIGKAMRTRNPNQKKYLILETSFFHKKVDLQKFQHKSNIKVVFLPANTPMLNPTEYLFNEVKQLVKSKSYKIKRPYASVLTQTLETLKQKNMQSYYTCIRPYLELALKQQPFK